MDAGSQALGVEGVGPMRNPGRGSGKPGSLEIPPRRSCISGDSPAGPPNNERVPHGFSHTHLSISQAGAVAFRGAGWGIQAEPGS